MFETSAGVVLHSVEVKRCQKTIVIGSRDRWCQKQLSSGTINVNARSGPGKTLSTQHNRSNI